ncbi:MAG: hypothetical protein II970_01350 [Paludibacteraceae bacterium]|nr:hypothetical protein [Paludibacteraceae bacterium]
MKRVLLLLTIPFLLVSRMYPTDENSRILGPVKIITETLHIDNNNVSLHYGEQPGGQAKIISWYDSIGRLAERANYINEVLVDGYVRQYTINNVCMEYNYDKTGLIKGSFTQIQMDSVGNHIFSRNYKDGKLFHADSTAYNAQGLKSADYETLFKADTLVLSYTYEYDSLGRVSKVTDMRSLHYYTIEYYPNSNYTEHHFDKNGKKWDCKYIVNNKGQVINKQDPNLRVQYSNFDKYGNWLKMKGSTNTQSPLGWITTITERTIEYYENER